MRSGKWLLAGANRGKALARLLLVLSALASVAGYLFLTEKITAGKRELAEGQRRLESKEPALEEGKARLEAGRLRQEEMTR